MDQPNSKCNHRSDNDGTREIFSALHACPNGHFSQSFVQSSPTRWDYGILQFIFHPAFHISLSGRFMQVAANVPPKSLLEDVLLIIANFDSRMSVQRIQIAINIPPKEGEGVETIVILLFVFQENFNIIAEPRSMFSYRDSCVVRTYSLLFPFLCGCYSIFPFHFVFFHI